VVALTAWICLAPPERMTRNPVYHVGSMAKAIAGASIGVTYARVCRERWQWPFDGIFAGSSVLGPAQRPKTPPGIGTVAMVNLAIVDLTAFIRRDKDEPIPPGRARYFVPVRILLHNTVLN